MERIAGALCPRSCSDETHAEFVKRMCVAQGHGDGREPRILAAAGACLGVTFLDPTANENTGQASSGIVFNGTLSNAAEVAGADTAAGSDAGAIVHQEYRKLGRDCANSLRGRFAFAIHDAENDMLVLVRDRIGTKPLYYTIRDRHVYFASEIKALMIVLPEKRPNLISILEWCKYRSVIGTDELIEGIHVVPPGHLLFFRDGELVESHAYYRPENDVDRSLYVKYSAARPSSIFSELTDTLVAAIDDCMDADVPVGSMLSSGIDSSVMTAIAAAKRPVLAVNVSVQGGGKLDERRDAEATARNLGIDFVSQAVDEASFHKSLPEIIYLNEAPLTHIQCVAFHFGAQLAGANGVKRLLVGDAADTLLGGNWTRQRVLLQIAQVFARLPHRLQIAIADATTTAGYIPTRPFFSPGSVHLVDGYVREGIREHCEQAYGHITSRIDRSILVTKLVHFVEDVAWYLRRGDRLGLEASLEYCAPFLDQRLVALSLNLPWHYQTHHARDKWALRKVASRDLPRKVAFRKKIAWDLPLKAYLMPFASADFLRDGICTELFGIGNDGIERLVRVLPNDPQSLFTFVNLEIWGRLFLRGQSVDQVSESIEGLHT